MHWNKRRRNCRYRLSTLNFKHGSWSWRPKIMQIRVSERNAHVWLYPCVLPTSSVGLSGTLLWLWLIAYAFLKGLFNQSVHVCLVFSTKYLGQRWRSKIMASHPIYTQWMGGRDSCHTPWGFWKWESVSVWNDSHGGKKIQKLYLYWWGKLKLAVVDFGMKQLDENIDSVFS